LKNRILSVRWRLVAGVASLAAAIFLSLPGGVLRPSQGPVSAFPPNLVGQIAEIWPNGAFVDDIIWPNGALVDQSSGQAVGS